MHIEDLLARVEKKYPCTEKEYPERKVLDETGKKRHERGHTFFHVSISFGRIASQLEQSDHGSLINRDATQNRIGKLLIDVMRLAVAFDMTPEDLKEYLDAWEKKDP